jgi:hypothetical protein
MRIAPSVVTAPTTMSILTIGDSQAITSFTIAGFNASSIEIAVQMSSAMFTPGYTYIGAPESLTILSSDL